MILSDTYYEFAAPLMRQLGYPTLLCHRLKVEASGRVADYVIRQPDPKRAAVHSFQSMNYTVIAAGDSYNDLSMLEQADYGILFNPPAGLARDYPEFPAAYDYGGMRSAFEQEFAPAKSA